MIDRPSPNHGPRLADRIDMLVVHYTGMESAQGALDRLCDPAAEVSCHYLIDEDGTLYALVPENRRAWHAGAAYWRGQTDINSRSIGIELVNPGHEFGYRPFPASQIAALTALGTDIVARHPIPPRNVVGHSDVAPVRKQDPGELFPWASLAHHDLGVWPKDGQAASLPILEALTLWGYDTSDQQAAIAAFQRHFRPAQVTGRADPETVMLANLLVSQFA